MDPWIRFIQQYRLPPDLLRYAKWVQEQRKSIATLVQRSHESERPKQWSFESDPDTPLEFKQFCRTQLATKHSLGTHRAFWDLVRPGRREGVLYDERRDFYTIKFNVIWQYLRLAEHGPVTKKLLWKKVCAAHRDHLRWLKEPVKDPTHRARVLNAVGLRLLGKARKNKVP
jgi:hypothetical protein